MRCSRWTRTTLGVCDRIIALDFVLILSSKYGSTIVRRLPVVTFYVAGERERKRDHVLNISSNQRTI